MRVERFYSKEGIMIKRLKITLVSAILSCCGAPPPNQTSLPIPPQLSLELEDAIEELNELLGIDLKKTIPIYEAEELRDEKYLGFCVYNSKRPIRIVVNTSRILKEGISLPLVLLHEVGHCVYNLDHTEGVRTTFDGCEAHIMGESTSSWTGGDRCWEKYKETYVEQILSNTEGLDSLWLFKKGW
jgi:hypothetical protein